MTVEHVQDRRQFGRTIGSYQAVKHRLADQWTAITQARAVARYAAACAASGWTILLSPRPSPRLSARRWRSTLRRKASSSTAASGSPGTSRTPVPQACQGRCPRARNPFAAPESAGHARRSSASASVAN
ncbi:acyl-CoA dehydrogenase family protein [Aeromicrobium sp. UC242_57]|uniref:acyl-CoA dehydrogenase family protein n=1 Tax=Aeromicrobium sp. UC242_57 TaxID=3374624 RepID=UPI00378EF6BE